MAEDAQVFNNIPYKGGAKNVATDDIGLDDQEFESFSKSMKTEAHKRAQQVKK